MTADDDRPLVVAAFDFDGTLIRGDSFIGFLTASCGRWSTACGALRSWRQLARLPLGGGRRDVAKAALLARTVAGRPLAELEEDGRRHAGRLRARLRDDVLARARWHRDQGHVVVVVSASLAVYLRPLCDELGFEVVATELEVGDDGRATGRIRGANVRAEEKLRRLRAWLGDRRARVWAYGDSEGDRAMLEAADVATRVGRTPLAPVPPPGATLDSAPAPE